MSIKIPLIKASSLGFERDMITFAVKYGSLPNFYASAIVDTGCPFCVISESTIKRLLKSGLIRANKVGGQYRILGKEILRVVSPTLEKDATKSYLNIKKKVINKINKW